ncbi:hypothetical protein ACFPN2_31700 [Steroidobacter flavus]|uniref:Uncharacterized protein n=1 Tax=Steroidobacter flavus TaxID=1842136 RepID=A0ABV8T185_9GAMM
MRTLIVLLLLAATGESFGREASQTSTEIFMVRPRAPSAERRFLEVVVLREAAIDHALGPILEDACTKITLEFAVPDDASYPSDAAAYDPSRHTLTFRRQLLGWVGRGVQSWARAYWPYYKNDDMRAMLPVIEIIDDALWMTHLQEAAHRKGLTWPPQECASLDIQKRLGCEMLVWGAMTSRRPAQPMFNTNRVDMFWPENLQELRARGWRQGDAVYRDVQQLGGSMLVRPLIAEFGVPRVLQYIAQTPFYIQDDNVRASVLQYQEQARLALTANAIN